MNLVFKKLWIDYFIKHYRKRIDKYMRSIQRYFKKLSYNTILYSIIMMCVMIFIGNYRNNLCEKIYGKKKINLNI